MKTAIVLLALASLAYSAPQPRKAFHENYNDFLMVIAEESGQAISELFEKYLEFDEFQAGIEYVASRDFKDLVFEMEDLPEFKAVIDFLEGHGIDIMFFIDSMNEMLDTVQRRRARQQVSGKDLTAFLEDSIALYPKDKLAELYNQKMDEDEDFANAMKDLESAEWGELFQALLDNETFQKEAQTLSEHGIDINVFFREIAAALGKF